MTAPTHLRLEHLRPGQPCGTPHPRLSWWLPGGSTEQHAYQIRVRSISGRTPRTLFTTDVVEGRDHVLVRPWTATDPVPTAGEERTWQVRCWTDLGPSEWSEPCPWTTGLLHSSDLTADWIEPHEPDVPALGHRPAYRLRASWKPRAEIAHASLFATAHGIYEFFVNDIRVGDQDLTPGFTAYRTHLQVQHFDVTELLQPRDNELAILLSDGWFRGRHGFERRGDGFGDRVAALAELHIRYADGTSERFGTGDGWTSAPSEIEAADLMDGQRVDLRRASAEEEHHPAVVARGGLYDDRDRLITGVAPPVRRIENLAAVAVTAPRPGSYVADFGQNVNGWVVATDLGPDGTHVTLTHGESLAADGSVDTDHLRAFDFATGDPLPAGQVDHVVSSGPGGVFEPRHSTHGFRYVQIDGLPTTPRPESIAAAVVHTDLDQVGSFTCDNGRLDKLHDAAVWSFRGNACDVPTDCPQRERSGFTGDWQIYVETAAFTHDVAGFSDKWLRDLAADQWPDGTVTTIVPNPAGNQPSGNHFADISNGSAGWGDAAVIVPWQLWRLYDDVDVVERQYDSMTRWVDLAAGTARDHRHPDRARLRPTPEDHEQYLWDTGFHWGEWLEPDEVPAPDPHRDHSVVATAYLARSAGLLAQMADVLGRDSDARRYAVIAAGAVRAWQREFVTPDGTLTHPTQANYVRALEFELVPAELRQRFADELARVLADNDYRLGTGFLATGMLLPVLARNGHLDTAYRVLLSTGSPSWMEMIDRGATTIWERWDGVDENGRATGSLNHYSKGAVVSFLHQFVAGLRPAETTGPGTVGYRRFIVDPRPGGGIGSARAEHCSPYGTIVVNWRIADDLFTLTLTVPEGSECELRLGDTAELLRAGTYTRSCPAARVTRRLSRASPTR
ncbi:Bacterial alpha-L-rhamnosidase [Rhodococcus opacus]|nr:Bacterial alpha-L-rhamnosidase [Rhodococcus opacus]